MEQKSYFKRILRTKHKISKTILVWREYIWQDFKVEGTSFESHVI